MHHLGPDRSLSLSTWDELVAAAKGGLLDENQWCELKQQLPPSDKKNNLELARDLAALSVHGGVLIIGIKDNGAEVVGLDEDVTALKSRISNVARTRVDPPLSPVIHDPIVGPGGGSVIPWKQHCRLMRGSPA